ncbi:MAG: glycosyltransferase, partial [Nakamurella sp.]
MDNQSTHGSLRPEVSPEPTTVNNYLLCATPAFGHVAPMIAIGQHLVSQGHRVRMLTGSRFADKVAAAGMEHISLPVEADFDDRVLDERFSEGQH